jgi:hypothetical protein
MADSRGHIRISRTFFDDDPFWNEPRVRTKAEAWIDLLVLAAWRPREYQTKYGSISLGRGEFVASRRSLATRWGWTEKVVRHFVETLTNRGQLKAQHESKSGTIYLIVDYDAYASGGPTGGPEDGPDTGRVRAQSGPSEGPREKQLSSKAERKEMSAAFLRAWSLYPKRPNNNRQKAWQAWSARLTAGETEAALLSGTTAYAAYCAARETPGEYIKQAATFYGPNRHYLDDYTVTPANRNGKHRPVDDGIHDEPQLTWVDDRPAARLHGLH